MASDRETTVNSPALPDHLAKDLSGYSWGQNLVGQSGAAVYRLYGKPGAPELYAKSGAGPVSQDLAEEMVRLRWIGEFLPAPAVIQFHSTSEATWLVMTALPGQTAYQLLEARPDLRGAIVDALADFLRRLHAIPISQCPFSADHGYRLGLARKRIEAGEVDELDFDEERLGWSAADVWQALQQHLPLAPDPVVTHGDFSLDNLLISQGAVTGCIDVGRLGIADRYQDIAIMWNCLGEFGSELQRRFATRYGLAQIDTGKLEFHLLLDELF